MYINCQELIDIGGQYLDLNSMKLHTICSLVWFLMYINEWTFLERHFLRYIHIRLSPWTSVEASSSTNNTDSLANAVPAAERHSKRLMGIRLKDFSRALNIHMWVGLNHRKLKEKLSKELSNKDNLCYPNTTPAVHLLVLGDENRFSHIRFEWV